jgi:bifunctional DNA-binding transcriptional regulator/antitoxin component of YhaV-PrlF toxin-antitoxin module
VIRGTARIAACPESLPGMPTLKLHHDGWIALPVRLRQALGLNSGDRLEAELADGALVLRPVGKTRGSAPAQGTAVPGTVQATGMLTLTADPEPVRRRPGRPRKATTAAVEGSATRKRGRDRPCKTALAQDVPAAAAPPSALGPPKLVKKVDREAAALPADHPRRLFGQPCGSVRSGQPRLSSVARPFRNVEIRPPGPGRGHEKRPSGGTRRPPD